MTKSMVWLCLAEDKKQKLELWCGVSVPYEHDAELSGTAEIWNSDAMHWSLGIGARLSALHTPKEYLFKKKNWDEVRPTNREMWLIIGDK